jgi:hypothetical protein
MLKHVTILGALLALGAAPSAAQQREAELQRMRVAGADFDVVLAIPKSPPRMLDDLNMSPDALIMHLTGGQLVVAFEDPIEMVKAADSLRSSVSSFHCVSKDSVSKESKSCTPLALYVVPKGE